MIKPKHECGIAAFSCLDNVAEKLYRMLLILQHRGQASAGIAVIKDDFNVEVHRGLGLVNQVFETENPEMFKRIMEKLNAKIGIAHTRYSTSGKEDMEKEIQPFYRRHPKLWKRFLLALNGQLTNYKELKEELEKSQYHFETNTDTEVILVLLSQIIKELSKDDKMPRLEDVIANLSRHIDGSYNLALLLGNKQLAIVRDPLGFRPLCYFYDKDSGIFAASSESIALTSLGYEITDFVKPGEIIIYKDGKIKKKIFSESERKAYCMFERVYFMHDASNVEEGNIYKIRYKLGKNLAKRIKEKLGNKVKEYIVVPVPDSGIAAGNAIADYLGIKLESRALVKNQEARRAFINEKNERNEKMLIKYFLNRELLKSKKIIMVDDSLVRGETSKKIVELLRKANPEEIYFAVSCPPIIYPCFYGIDFPTKEELFASKYKDLKIENLEDKVKNNLNIAGFSYQTIEGLVDAIGLTKKELCLACLNGDYPTEGGLKRYKRLE